MFSIKKRKKKKKRVKRKVSFHQLVDSTLRLPLHLSLSSDIPFSLSSLVRLGYRIRSPLPLPHIRAQLIFNSVSDSAQISHSISSCTVIPYFM
ncbi:unnamed protein product [Rhodiola kirilowii]